MIETREGLIALRVTKEVFKKSCFDRRDMKRLIEKELKKFNLDNESILHRTTKDGDNVNRQSVRFTWAKS